jgi:hypothetical protein
VKKIDLLINLFYCVISKNKMESMLLSVWFMSMVVLLLCSNVIPNAFSVAITIFYVPLVVFAFYVLFLIVPKDMWLLFGLMCLFLYNL